VRGELSIPVEMQFFRELEDIEFYVHVEDGPVLVLGYTQEICSGSRMMRSSRRPRVRARSSSTLVACTSGHRSGVHQQELAVAQ